MVPAIVTTDNYLLLTVHFLLNNLNKRERPKIDIALDKMQITSYKPKKLIEKT